MAEIELYRGAYFSADGKTFIIKDIHRGQYTPSRITLDVEEVPHVPR